MSKIIKVIGEHPLKVRFGRGEPFTVLEPGEHELTADQAKHWYIKGALEDGRARLLAIGGGDDPEGVEKESNDDPETTLHLVQRSELEETEAKLTAEAQAREEAEAKLADEIAAHDATKAKLAELEARLQESEDPAPEQEPEDLESKMLAAFPKLAESDMTTGGTPKVKAVEALLGTDVTADQVAAAWAKFQEGKE